MAGTNYMMDFTRTLKDGCPPQTTRGIAYLESCHIEVNVGLDGWEKHIDWQNTHCHPIRPMDENSEVSGSGQHPDYYRDANAQITGGEDYPPCRWPHLC